MRILQIAAVLAVLALSASAFSYVSLDIPFAAGQAASAVVRVDTRATGLKSGTAVLLTLPESWPGGDLVLNGSPDLQSDLLPIYDADGVRIRLKTGSGRHVVLDPSTFWGLSRIQFVRVQTGTETPQPVSTAVTCGLVIR